MKASDIFCQCSACGADLRAGVKATAPCDWGCDQDAHYSRAVGMVENDRVTEWMCPDCGRTVPRGVVR